MSAGSRDGHFVGGSSERARIPNFGGVSTLSAGRHEVFSHSTNTGRASQTRRGTFQHLKSERLRRGIFALRCFSTDGCVNTHVRDDDPGGRDKNEFGRFSQVNVDARSTTGTL